MCHNAQQSDDKIDIFIPSSVYSNSPYNEFSYWRMFIFVAFLFTMHVQHVREIKWSLETPRHFLDANHGKEFNGEVSLLL